MKNWDFARLKNCIKTNDSAIMDKPYRRSRKKIIAPSVSPYILSTEIKNNKQYYWFEYWMCFHKIEKKKSKVTQNCRNYAKFSLYWSKKPGIIKLYVHTTILQNK